MVPGRSHPKNGFKQGKAVLLHRDHRHPQALGEFLHGHIIQEDRLPVAEGVLGQKDPGAQVLPLELGQQVLPGEQARYRNGLSKKWFTTG